MGQNKEILQAASMEPKVSPNLPARATEKSSGPGESQLPTLPVISDTASSTLGEEGAIQATTHQGPGS